MKTRFVSLPLLSLLGAAPCMLTPVLAQSTGHAYSGVSVGQSRTEIDAPFMAGTLLPGVGLSSVHRDQKDTAYKLFGGYQFNRNIALEGGYFDLGHNRFNGLTSPAGRLSGDSRVRGLNLDVVGTIPLTERLSVLGRVGAQHAWSRSHFQGTGAAASAPGTLKRDDSSFKLGAGLQYAFTPSVLLRGEVERYRINNAVGRRANVDVASLSLVFPWGQSPAPRVAAAPVYVAPPEPMPVVVAPPAPVVVPEPVVLQNVTFSADALFGFDATAVGTEGRTALDGFGQKLQGTTYSTIRVEGHTDRMGSDAYNQSLSQGRADAVKDYLVRGGNIDAAKVSAVGMGERQPVTALSDCPDQQARGPHISCLQPDRRVEVEVSGTR